MGVGGKILPRLPEGTRVGKLVMGKYGLYCPKLRKQVEAYSVSDFIDKLLRKQILGRFGCWKEKRRSYSGACSLDKSISRLGIHVRCHLGLEHDCLDTWTPDLAISKR
jgi:hypothetical protein